MSDDNATAEQQPPERRDTEPAEAARGHSEFMFYLLQIPGLWAGRAVPLHPIHATEPAPVDGADDESLRLLLDTASHQLDACVEQLEQIRQRSQFLFTTVLALVGLATVALRAVAREDSLVGFLVWCAAFVALLLALLGSASLMVNKKVLGELDAAWLTRRPQPWLRELVQDAIKSVTVSRTTVANQVTYLRDAALFTIAGATLLGVAWLIAVL